MITNCIMSLSNNCMVILKSPEESCLESVLSLEPAEGMAQDLLSQSVSQSVSLNIPTYNTFPQSFFPLSSCFLPKNTHRKLKRLSSLSFQNIITLQRNLKKTTRFVKNNPSIRLLSILICKEFYHQKGVIA